jgi:hypothetical protein
MRAGAGDDGDGTSGPGAPPAAPATHAKSPPHVRSVHEDGRRAERALR